MNSSKVEQSSNVSGPNRVLGYSESLSSLKDVIEHVAHLLPSQGPINVFIHHNTLHAFEHLRFEEAVKKGTQRFGCQPYLTEDRYRQKLLRGRLRFADLDQVIGDDLGARAEEKILGLCTRRELRLAMVQYPLHTGPTEELMWHVAETDALRRVRAETSSVLRARLIAETRRWVMRDLRPSDGSGWRGPFAPRVRSGPFSPAALLDRFEESTIEMWTQEEWEEFTLRLLWGVCCDGAAVVAPPPVLPLPCRHRGLLLAATGADADLLVHDVLIRFCAAFVDQGLARWQLPHRDEGFSRSFYALYGSPGGPPDAWLRGLPAEIARLQRDQISPLASIRESLELLGVVEEEWEDYLSDTLLALRGWAGMIRQIELRGDRVVRPAPEGSLMEFLAVRLLLDRLALAFTSRNTLAFKGPLRDLRYQLREQLCGARPPVGEQRAFLVFQLAQVLGWTPERLHSLKEHEWAVLLREIEDFSELERRRVLHLTYERHFYERALDALALHVPKAATGRPRFQVLFCIDERQESLRRHLEELAPDVQTFSAAGFFFVPMYYRGASAAHFTPLCPAVMQPRHWVVEQVEGQLRDVHQRRARVRHWLGRLTHGLHVGSRGMALGALIAGVAGVLSTAPLVARTIAPRLTAKLRRRLGHMVRAPRLTRLRLERSEPDPGPDEGHIGFRLDEMTDIGECVLRDIGLTSQFARLVLVLGHGSTSLNNPHESAHDCGACGGSRGGPNARALTQMLNDPRVRERLERRGLRIPTETYFVGGMHNTSSAAVAFHDLDLLPPTHRGEFESINSLFQQACERDAHERSRRFDSAPLTLSFAAARQHVEGRAEDLGQVRPEWGHATNALHIVGRREQTRGLFLDRRAFLTSYDPTQDDAEHTILTRVLQAVSPVCAGISLEYYFSSVDNPGWGSGTKLPHNITGLLGVMDGAGSDLRTGLPWQMVEIHEPIRLLQIVETTPEAMLAILERDADLAQLFRNDWMRLAVAHPHTRKLSVYKDGRFVDYEPRADALPRAASSFEWYRGWRGHLEFAEIES
ncbi:MAG: DUF2309 domain-containing protein [Gemmataceae bacterium]